MYLKKWTTHLLSHVLSYLVVKVCIRQLLISKEKPSCALISCEDTNIFLPICTCNLQTLISPTWLIKHTETTNLSSPPCRITGTSYLYHIVCGLKWGFSHFSAFRLEAKCLPTTWCHLVTSSHQLWWNKFVFQPTSTRVTYSSLKYIIMFDLNRIFPSFLIFILNSCDTNLNICWGTQMYMPLLLFLVQ